MKKPEYKNYTTSKFRADLHRRLKMLAAARGEQMQDVFNQVIETGLDVEEAKK